MFIPHSAEISAPNGNPRQWLVVLHGIFGRGANWRSFARKFCELRPDWGVLLTDLRMHGKSTQAPPPHDLHSCAADVLALVAARAQQGAECGGVLGHSFGGKVALEMRLQRPSLSTLWVIDSSAGPRPGAMDDKKNTVVSVLRLLERLPEVFSDRNAFTDLVIKQGFPSGLAQWLAMNLEPCEGGYRCMLEVRSITSLLASYFDRDLWKVIEASSGDINIVRASRESTIDHDDLLRMRVLEKQGNMHLHELQGGHWLHVDALPQLVELVASRMS